MNEDKKTKKKIIATPDLTPIKNTADAMTIAAKNRWIETIYADVQRKSGFILLAAYGLEGESHEEFAQTAMLLLLDSMNAPKQAKHWAWVIRDEDRGNKHPYPALSIPYLAERGILLAKRKYWREMKRKVTVFDESSFVPQGNDNDFYSKLDDRGLTSNPYFPSVGEDRGLEVEFEQKAMLDALRQALHEMRTHEHLTKNGAFIIDQLSMFIQGEHDGFLMSDGSGLAIQAELFKNLPTPIGKKQKLVRSTVYRNIKQLQDILGDAMAKNGLLFTNPNPIRTEPTTELKIDPRTGDKKKRKQKRYLVDQGRLEFAPTFF